MIAIAFMIVDFRTNYIKSCTKSL